MTFWKKKKKPVPETENFHDKVDRFWEWFESRSQHFLDEIDAGRCGDLQPEVSAKVNQMWPSFAWVFGPPPDGKSGHSFTLSGEGLIQRQILTEEWLRRAPDLENWTFYASRQPGTATATQRLTIYDVEFAFAGFWVAPVIDEENEEVDITAWHPSFEKVDKDQRMTPLFLMLDEVLGEYGVDNWIGRIETSDGKLADSMPALELRDFLHDLEIERGWRKYPPPQCFSVYSLKEPPGGFLRGDAYAGSTNCMRLVNEYLRNEGPIENPLDGSGAEILFVAFDSGILPEGGAVEFRGQIEDALEVALAKENAGQVLGGAIGVEFSYIDLINFKGARGRELIEQAICDKGLPESTAIHKFTK